MDLDYFKKKMEEVSDEKFNETISKGALHLSDEQINTVSFVFWLIYMAETDLNDILQRAWKLSSEAVPDPEANKLAKEMIREMIYGKRVFTKPLEEVIKNLPEDQQKEIIGTVKEQYKKKQEFDIENPEYFIDKIKVLQAFYGSNARTEVLWILNNLRNDISHNRIDGLLYKEKSLQERSTKEELLLDYFKTSDSVSILNSNFWKSLSPQEQTNIEAQYKKNYRAGITA